MTSDASAVDLIGRSKYALAANGLTIARFVLAPVFALLILEQNPWWLTFWFGWALGATDLFDGKLARHAAPTKFGAFFDPLADKLVVLLAGFALVEIGRFVLLPWILITVRELGIMAYRSYWGRRGISVPARTSAKYKTFVQGIAVSAATCPALDGALWVADVLLWAAVAFTIVTGIQYLADGSDSLRTTGER